ncbi:MAG: hypothetical protein AWU54_2251 [Candidatus Frackibacter sp. T328-2]|nr:MAG: hypothetical protein AWU54_2251 [Candidatus Frackibacter sp. T328-2]
MTELNDSPVDKWNFEYPADDLTRVILTNDREEFKELIARQDTRLLYDSDSMKGLNVSNLYLVGIKVS